MKLQPRLLLVAESALPADPLCAAGVHGGLEQLSRLAIAIGEFVASIFLSMYHALAMCTLCEDLQSPAHGLTYRPASLTDVG